MKDWCVMDKTEGVAIVYNLDEIEAKSIAEKIGSENIVARTYEEFIEIRKELGKSH